MTNVLWLIAIGIGSLAYVIFTQLRDARLAAKHQHLSLECLLERIAKALESMQQIQEERRDDSNPDDHETLEERDRRWESYRNK